MRKTWVFYATMLKLLFRLFLVATTILASTVLGHADVTGAWTVGATTASTNVRGITVSYAGAPGGAAYTNGTLGTQAAYWSDPYGGTIANGASVSMNIGTTGATITVTFSEPVNNPVLHADRIGGAVNNTSNSSIWTLSGSTSQGGSVSMTRLSGNPQFVLLPAVNPTSFRRTVNVTDNGSTECESPATNGTACGSVQFNGTGITSLTFTVTIGGPNGQDGVEFRWSFVGSNVIVRKQSVGGTATFNFTGTNGIPAATFPLNTGTSNPISSSVFAVTNHANPITITEAALAGYVLTATGCVDGGGTTVASSLAGQVLTVAAAAYGGNQTITCTFTNGRLPQVTVTKITQGGIGTFNFTGNNGIASHNIATTTPGTGVAGAVQTLTTASQTSATTVTESVPPTGFVLVSANCTGLSGGATATFTPATRTMSIPAAGAAPGTAISCTFTNGVQADLSIAKTNTPASGPSDQASDVVVAGTQTTYTIVVTNNGPGAVVAPVVRDTPDTTLACPAGNAVSCSGVAGVCAGTYTVGGITGGSGITLGTMASGATATLSFQCLVQ